MLFYKESNTREFAFIASKKVGNAVYRNRAKRVLKAHFIEYSPKLKNGKYIFVAKASIVNSNYKKLNSIYLYIYKKLKLYII